MITEKFKSYKDLEIYQISFDLAVKIYFKSLELPNHDKYEVGSQCTVLKWFKGLLGLLSLLSLLSPLSPLSPVFRIC